MIGAYLLNNVNHNKIMKQLEFKLQWGEHCRILTITSLSNNEVLGKLDVVDLEAAIDLNYDIEDPADLLEFYNNEVADPDEQIDMLNYPQDPIYVVDDTPFVKSIQQ